MTVAKRRVISFMDEKAIVRQWRLMAAKMDISFPELCRDAASSYEKEVSLGLRIIVTIYSRFKDQINFPVEKMDKEATKVTVLLPIEDHARLKKFAASQKISLGFFMRHALHNFTMGKSSEIPLLESNLAVVEKITDSKSKSGEFVSSNLSGQKQLNWTEMASRVIFCLYAEMTNKKGLTWTWKDFRQLLSSHPEVIGKIIKSTNPALHEEIGSSMLPAVIAVTKYHCQELMSH